MSKPQKEIQRSSFEKKLQEIIWDLFVEVVPIQQEGSIGSSCILVKHLGSWGDSWSGYTDDYVITLENFIRPDNQEKLIFELKYSIHNLSGQMDYWTARVEGALENEKELFMDLLNPYLWNGYGVWTSNHISVIIKWNGEEIKI